MATSILRTNRDVFELLRESKISFKNVPLTIDKIEEICGIEPNVPFKIKIKKFCSKLQMRWVNASRVESRFISRNKNWLDAPFQFPTMVELRARNNNQVENFEPGKDKKCFRLLSDRQKRRRTEYIRGLPDEHISYAAKKHLKSKDAEFIFDFVKTHPEHAKAIRFFCENLGQSNKCLNNVKALSLFVSAKLTKFQYNLIRDSTKESGHDCFPSYFQITQAKNDCYPSPESVTITESSAAITLQSLLDKTIHRLLKTIKPTEFTNLTLISKWGCDGSSDQSQYKIGFSNNSRDDSSVFMCSFVPIKLFDTDTNTVIWINEKPSSTRMCRPISFQFAKETDVLIHNTVDHINNQIENLLSTNCDGDIKVEHKLCFTMIDGKICNTISNTQSSMRCYICQASPKEMNVLQSINEKIFNEEFYSFGLSPLHAWIRCFECLLHISYNIPFKSWSVRNSNHKQQRLLRKQEIQAAFRNRLGLLVDIVKQGKGSTNDGNTARKFFSNLEISSEITGLDFNLLKKFFVILQTISSGHKIDVAKFKQFTFETAQLYVSLYNWYYMPASVHKLLLHGAEIVQYALVPIGLLSEEAQEANHKLFREYRRNHARKMSRTSNNEDILHSLLLASDPVISDIRPNFKNRFKELLPETMELLDLI